MTEAITRFIPPERREAWRWWEGRRLRYNIGLGVAGWTAYALFWLLQFAFDWSPASNWQGALGMTLFLGAGFLGLMALANIFYLLGVLAESISRPSEVDQFRTTTWNLGFWGSIALPFLFPLGTFAALLAQSGSP